MFGKTEGIVQQVAGGIQDTFGKATGDSRHQVEGKARQAAGRTEEVVSDAIDQAQDTARNHPIGTLTIVAGVAFILGALWAKP